MNIHVINHTAHEPHHGCRATCAALIALLNERFTGATLTTQRHDYREGKWDLYLGPLAVPLRARRLRRDPRFTEADLIVVNAEGSMYGKPWRKSGAASNQRLVEAAAAARKLNKPVWIVNGSAGPGGRGFRRLVQSTYGSANHVAVREPSSLAFLRECNISSVQAADAILSTTPPPPAENSPLAGKIALTDSSAWSRGEAQPRREAAKKLAESLKSAGLEPVFLSIRTDDHDRKLADQLGLDFFTFPDRDEFLSHLQNARLVVCGRFHTAVFAALCATPFLAFEANTYKLAGFCELLQHPFPPFNMGAGTEASTARVLQAVEKADTIRQRLTAQQANTRALARLNLPETSGLN